MKIEGTLKPVGTGSVGEARNRPQPGAQQTAPNGAKVELSSLSSTLARAEAAIAETPAVDSKRVEEIKQAIAEGRFKVDAGRIADGLITSVRQMLDSQSQS